MILAYIDLLSNPERCFGFLVYFPDLHSQCQWDTADYVALTSSYWIGKSVNREMFAFNIGSMSPSVSFLISCGSVELAIAVLSV